MTTIIPEMTRLSDPASSTVTYMGLAAPGTATSAALWQISKITFDGSGNFLSQKWADGNGNLDNVWDDRASLTYV
jgi:hypothetical protein